MRPTSMTLAQKYGTTLVYQVTRFLRETVKGIGTSIAEDFLSGATENFAKEMASGWWNTVTGAWK